MFQKTNDVNDNSVVVQCSRKFPDFRQNIGVMFHFVAEFYLRTCNVSDCADWSFTGSKTSTDLAVMKLNTFALRPDKRDRTVLNVSLSNIKFTSE